MIDYNKILEDMKYPLLLKSNFYASFWVIWNIEQKFNKIIEDLVCIGGLQNEVEK